MQALGAKTPVTMMDEPTDSLDPSMRIYLISLLKRLAKAGRTILFSSHQLDEVGQLCDRIAFLSSGKKINCFYFPTAQVQGSSLQGGIAPAPNYELGVLTQKPGAEYQESQIIKAASFSW